MDGLRDIGAIVGRNVHHHSHDGAILPIFNKWSSMSVTIQWCRSRGCVDTTAVGHATGAEYLVNQSWLREVECIGSVFFYLNAKECINFSFIAKLERVMLSRSTDTKRSDFGFQESSVRTSKEIVVNVHHAHKMVFEEKAWIEFRLSMSAFQQTFSEFLNKRSWCLPQSIQTLKKLENKVAFRLGTK